MIDENACAARRIFGRAVMGVLKGGAVGPEAILLVDHVLVVSRR
jgi:hypothetical protein